MHKFLVRKLARERRNYLEDLGRDGQIILKLIFKKIEWKSVKCIHLAQHRD